MPGRGEAAVYLPETVRSGFLGFGFGAGLRCMEAVKSAPARLRQLSDSADPANPNLRSSLRPRRKKMRDAPLGATVDNPASCAEYRGGLAWWFPMRRSPTGATGLASGIVNNATSTVTFRPVTILRLSDEENVPLEAALRSGEHIIALGAPFTHRRPAYSRCLKTHQTKAWWSSR